MSSIKQNFFYNLLLNFSNIIFPIITFPYASRILGPEGIGKVQFVSTFVQYFVLLAALGIPIYGIREIARYKSDPFKLKALFSELMFLNIITTILISVIYVLIINLVPSLYADVEFYKVALFMLLFSFCNVDWLFSGLEKFRFIAIRSVVVKAIAIVILFVLVRTKSDDIYYLGILIGITVVNNLWNIWASRKYFSAMSISFQELKKHFKPLLFIFSTVAAISVYALLDTLILGFLKGFEAVGYYSAGTKINRMAIPVLTSLGTVLIPRISHAFKSDDLLQIKTLTHSSLDLIVILGVPMSIGLIVLSPELIYLFSGTDFLPSIVPMQIFAPVVLIIGISNVFAIQILTPARKDKYVTISVCIGLLSSLIFNFILIPLYSFTGAAITNLISELIVMLSFIYFTTRVIAIKFDYILLFKSLIVSICFFPILYMLRIIFADNVLIITGLGLVICSVIYFLTHFYIIKNSLFMEQSNRIIARLINKV